MPAQPLLDDTFLRAQWAAEFDTFQATSASTELFARLRAWVGRDRLKLLLTLHHTTEEALRQRILTLDHEIITLDKFIATKESELNALTFQLYHLTPEEIAMVEGG